MADTLHIALKEWDLTIRMMLAGRQAVLLRKGGILESENQFVLEHPRFLFYPTFVHQDPRMVKPEFRPGLKMAREEPREIPLTGYAEVLRIFEVPGRPQLEQLNDLHVWDRPLLDMRFSYRPEKPLYLVVARAYALAIPLTIENTLDYAGCKSWVPLLHDIEIAGATAALDDTTMKMLLARIEETFAD